MKIRLYMTIILMALLISGVVPIVLAQDIAAGLSPGYQFTYSVTGSYFTVDASVEIPEEVINAQESVYYKVMIDNVTGPDIGYSWLWYFANGTDKKGTGTLNLETQTNTGPFWAIVPANLKAGERIHPNFGPDTSSFNQTLMWTYTNYTRETNCLKLQIAYQNEAAQAFKNVTSESYFDKQTGMLIQLSEKTVYQNPAFTTIITWKLLDQNVWTSSSPGSYQIEPFFTLPVVVSIAIVVAVVVVIGALVVFNKRKETRRRQLLRKK